MHVTAGALLVRGDAEILLVEHLAYGITLQPGGHLEPTDTTLIGAAVRELAEATGVDPGKVSPALQTPVNIDAAAGHRPCGSVGRCRDAYAVGGAGLRSRARPRPIASIR